MKNKDIPNILPQNYPFIFVDGIIEFTKDPPKITCYKNVTITDNFFQGHFPNNPVMPGVLIIEALAQTGLILFSQIKGIENKERDKYNYYLGKTEARFKKPVTPGDKLILKVEIEKSFNNKAIIKGTALVKEETVATSTIIFVCVPKNPSLKE